MSDGNTSFNNVVSVLFFLCSAQFCPILKEQRKKKKEEENEDEEMKVDSPPPRLPGMCLLCHTLYVYSICHVFPIYIYIYTIRCLFN